MWTGYEPTPDCGISNHASPRAIKTTWQQHVLYFECIIMHVPEYTLALWMIGSVCRACMTSLFVHSLIARHAGVCTKITRGVHRVYSPLSHRVQLTNCLPVSSGMKLPPPSLSLPIQCDFYHPITHQHRWQVCNQKKKVLFILLLDFDCDKNISVLWSVD